MATAKRSGVKGAGRDVSREEPMAAAAARASRQALVDRYITAATPNEVINYTLESAAEQLTCELQQLRDELMSLDNKLTPIMDPERRERKGPAPDPEKAFGSPLRHQLAAAIQTIRQLQEHTRDMVSGADLQSPYLDDCMANTCD